MKLKLLLVSFIIGSIFPGFAQRSQDKAIVYAITAKEKGNRNWTEVRQINLKTGEQVESIYESNSEPTLLNARTGKPVVKKNLTESENEHVVIIKAPLKEGSTAEFKTGKRKVLTISDKDQIESIITETRKKAGEDVVIIKRLRTGEGASSEKPFSTNSAACAYDKKHDRLYYTPMGINQLRYIDLKSNTQKIFYFEDEDFGVVSGRHDVRNQITRMVFGSDGKGYALSNNAEHLISFTTKKRAEITDLGALTDDPSNGNISVHSRDGFGGDMIAGKSGALYLITANRRVFKIDIDSRVTKYLGTITGLPKGFTTNGAVVEDERNIMVCSATSTEGYFKFNLDDLKAEKISTIENVYNASDLANNALLADRKKDKKEEEKTDQNSVSTNLVERPGNALEEKSYRLSVYPNPVQDGVVKLSFDHYPEGKYEVQILDITGKILSVKNVEVSRSNQLEQVRLPKLIAKGTYFVKVYGDEDKVMGVEQLVVQ